MEDALNVSGGVIIMTGVIIGIVDVFFGLAMLA